MAKDKQRHITFCLCPGFPLFCIASALEVLRHANRFAGRQHYRWSLLCDDDQPIQDTNGLWLQPSQLIQDAGAADLSFVVAGYNPTEIAARHFLPWLKRQAMSGRVVGGISNGGFLLARARLLDGYAATVHWEDFASFCASFPRVRARYQRFIMDRQRMSCSGGTSTLDLFLEIVRQDLGNDLSMLVARQMLLQEYAVPGTDTPEAAFDVGHQLSLRVQRALSLIDPGIERALNVAELAASVGLSRRQLLRLFRRELGKTPGDVLRLRRLDRARSLVLHSHLPLSTVSSAVGFCSQSHMTSEYKRQFGITPSAHRRQHQTHS